METALPCASSSVTGGVMSVAGCDGPLVVTDADSSQVVSCHELRNLVLRGLVHLWHNGSSCIIASDLSRVDHTQLYMELAMGFLVMVLVIVAWVALSYWLLKRSMREKDRQDGHAGEVHFGTCVTFMVREHPVAELVCGRREKSHSYCKFLLLLLVCRAHVEACSEPIWASQGTHHSYTFRAMSEVAACMDSSPIQIISNKMSLLTRVAYTTAGWSLETDEPETFCISGGCQSRRCSEVDSITTVETHGSSTSHCAQSARSTTFCWNQGGCAMFRTRLVIDRRDVWDVLELHGFRPHLGHVQDCEAHWGSTESFALMASEATMVRSRLDGSLRLCRGPSSHLKPHSSSLGDIQFNGPNLEGWRQAQDLFTCTTDIYSWKVTCKSKKSFASEIRRVCSQMPAQTAQGQVVLVNGQVIMESSEPSMLTLVCNSTHKFRKNKGTCSVHKIRKVGNLIENLVERFVVTTTAGEGELHITTTCAPFSISVPCSSESFLTGPISRACSVQGHDVVDETIQGPDLAGVEVTRSGEDPNLWAGFPRWSMWSLSAIPCIIIFIGVVLLMRCIFPRRP